MKMYMLMMEYKKIYCKALLDVYILYENCNNSFHKSAKSPKTLSERTLISYICQSSVDHL